MTGRAHASGWTGRFVLAAVVGVLVVATALAVFEARRGTSQRSSAGTPSSTIAKASSVEAEGSFRVECGLSHQGKVDPIVAPGRASHHTHDVFGNMSTGADSTYGSMRAASTNCSAAGDRAGYWSPTLVAPDGTLVKPERGVFYYRNRPVDDGTTQPFPPDLRMIAGGADAFPHAYWTCDGEKDTALSTRRRSIPNCGPGGKIKLHVFFPSCWDGERLDSPDHRSHVTYGLDENGVVDGTHPRLCPRSHPVKIPQLDFRVLYPVSDGSEYRLSSGDILPHADFWNTWMQFELEAWVERCLWGGVSCRLAEGRA